MTSAMPWVKKEGGLFVVNVGIYRVARYSAKITAARHADQIRRAIFHPTGLMSAPKKPAKRT